MTHDFEMDIHFFNRLVVEFHHAKMNEDQHAAEILFESINLLSEKSPAGYPSLLR